MHQHQPDAHGIEQGQVVHQILGRAIGQHFATDCNDKAAAAKGMDIRRSLPHPRDQPGIAFGPADTGFDGHGDGAIKTR